MCVEEFYASYFRKKAPNYGKSPCGDSLLDGADWEELSEGEREDVKDIFLRLCRMAGGDFCWKSLDDELCVGSA